MAHEDARTTPKDVVLLVEDHPLFVGALRDLIRHHYPGVEVFKSSTLAAAQAWLAGLVQLGRLRAVVCDLNLPDGQGLAVVQSLRALSRCPLLVLSADDDPSTVRAALDAGADGFVSKRADPDDLLRNLQRVMGPVGAVSPPAAGAMELLSASQRKVAEQLLLGLSNKDIARALHLSTDTVKTHVGEIIAKFGVRNRTEVALKLSGKLGE